ncbi:MAG: SPOR domain-containing protein [Gammaproteobacteria bacterium]|nr:SPOR domain-containing protein [Gammaproteobacteria bacterium]
MIIERGNDVDNVVKQRVIGAVVLVALAVIFVPMLLDKSETDLGPVGGNLPDQPEQIVHDRIEPLTLPEPPPETEPAQVVLDQPTPENAVAAAATALATGAPQLGTPPAPNAPNVGVSEDTVTAPQPAVPVPAVPAATPAPVTATPPAAPTPAAPVVTQPAPAPAVTAPAPVAKPAPAPAKALSGWVVQLVATATKSKALALQEQLRALGYTAFVEEIKTAQGVLFRVRVGPELERANAENVRNRLEQQVHIKGIVTRYP